MDGMHRRPWVGCGVDGTPGQQVIPIPYEIYRITINNREVGGRRPESIVPRPPGYSANDDK